MGLVLEGLFALGLILVVLWLWSLRGSVAKDAATNRERQAQAALDREKAEREARLVRPGELLRCLSCEKTFLGPLPATGCPFCHLAAFVVAEADWQQRPQAAVQNGEN